MRIGPRGAFSPGTELPPTKKGYLKKANVMDEREEKKIKTVDDERWSVDDR